ncbi:MAG: class I SAM-dependent methyltransferase [Candidatus Saccharibacteria bacterium]
MPASGYEGVIEIDQRNKSGSKDRAKINGGYLQKQLLDKLFSLIKNGSFTVRYWDGTESKHGDGPPMFRLIINDKSVVARLVTNPALAFGEGYMDGVLEIDGEIEAMIKLINMNQAMLKKLTDWKIGRVKLTGTSIKQQKSDISHHYDLGNEFFARWLDPTMSYSCAYFHSPDDTLEEAQLRKIDYTLKKLQLKPGETMLDIGSGWGWMIIHAAREYGVKSTGITLSQEQFEATRQRLKDMDLEDQAEVLLMDYRELASSRRKFDKVVSVGMLEHVGQQALPLFLSSVKNLLKPSGLMLLHSITHVAERAVNPWIEKYIFPGGYIPSLRKLIWLLPENDLHLQDVECLRMHYAMTLDRWSEAFEQNLDPIIKEYGERFVRMWRFYLQSCAATFRYSGLSIHQLLFSRELNNELPLTRDYLYV